MLDLVYVFDPLCGWCYGNGPSINQVEQELAKEVKINVISGGMVMQQHAQPMRALRNFLTNAIPQLEQTTGVKISEAYRQNILDNDNVTLDSEIPSMVFTALKPYSQSAVKLASQIQEVLFVKGLNTNKWESFKELFHQYHPEQSAAIAKVKNDAANREKAYDGFKQSQQMGVRGYPALLLHHQGQYFTLANGYAPAEQIIAPLKTILSELRA